MIMNKSHSLMMDLGQIPVPEHFYAKRPECVRSRSHVEKMNPNRYHRRVAFKPGQKDRLISEIQSYLYKGSHKIDALYYQILEKQESDKNIVIPKNQWGDYLSLTSFKDLYWRTKKDFPGIRKKYNKESEVSRLFKDGLSRSEIAIALHVKEANIQRILVKLGLVEKVLYQVRSRNIANERQKRTS